MTVGGGDVNGGGERVGFPVDTHPGLRPGGVAILAIGGAGMEVGIEDGRVVIRRRIVAARIVGLLEEEQLEILER